MIRTRISTIRSDLHVFSSSSCFYTIFFFAVYEFAFSRQWFFDNQGKEPADKKWLSNQGLTMAFYGFCVFPMEAIPPSRMSLEDLDFSLPFFLFFSRRKFRQL